MPHIRIGTCKDIKNICELLIDTWRTCYSSFIPADFLSALNLDHQIQRHQKYLTESATYFIAEDDKNRLLGFASFGNNRKINVNSFKEIYTLYVHKNAQGKGIGKLLLNSILEELQFDCAAISVSVFEENPYKGFYLKNEFVKVADEIIDMGTFELESGVYILKI